MKIYQLMSLIPLETLSRLFRKQHHDFLCLCNIVVDTVVKEYILIVSEDTNKSLFA